MLFRSTCEYLLVVTNKKTAKRIRVSELDNMSRAKKGSLLIKKVKSGPYLILKCFFIDTQSQVKLKIDGEFKEIKVVDIPIMDFASTGSAISKSDIVDVVLGQSVVECKIDENETVEEIEVLDISEGQQKKVDRELTIDDFIEDFKL